MRTLFKIAGFLSIFAAMFNAITVVVIYNLQSTDRLNEVNWAFTLPAILISGLVLAFGSAGVMTAATNPEIWKSLKELRAEREELQKEKEEVIALRDRMVNKLLKI